MKPMPHAIMEEIIVISMLFYCASCNSKAVDQCEYRALGAKLIIPLEYKDLKKTDEITWKLNNNKLMEWKKGQERTIYNEATLGSNGALQLEDIKKNHSGHYVADIFNKDGKLIKSNEKRICVIEKVSKPEIPKLNCENPILTCNVKNGEGVRYEWFKNQQKVLGNEAILKLNKQMKSNSNFYSCKASNEVSSEMSESLQIYCPGVSERKLFGLDFWVMVAILATGGGLILILILVLVLCICRRRQQNKNREREEEELRLATMMQHPHPPRHHELPRGQAVPHTHPQNGEDYTPAPPKPRGKRPRPPPVPIPDEEQPPPRPKPRQSGPRHHRT